ncbi:MAG: energy-coupling factor transporter transmembrane protein EcfT [Nitrospira sp.]|nr:energy-coupling factor transporter transmembrane protein EcfT [Nitrospira sp.]
MSPEIKIILYIVFVICLFLIKNITVYLFIFTATLILLFRIPIRSLKSGLIPISLFLLFTFISNILFQHGRIIYSKGPIVITDEGLNIASVRTMRIFLMIAGAKILTATTQIELLVGAFGKILRPLERLGIPVVEFFSTMGLTMKALPRLKDHIMETYREKMKEAKVTDFRGRAKVISTFLMPLLVKSIQSPESFFKEKSMNEKPK